MANQYYAGLDSDLMDAALAAADPAAVDDMQATAAVATEETLAAQQQAVQAAAALAQQELLAQQMMIRHHHTWQRMNGTTFRTRIGTWQDMKAQRLAASGRLIRVAGAVMTGYAGDLQYRVVNPHGALMRWRDGSLMPNVKAVAPGTIVLGTPRGDGYIVEVSSGGLNGWLNALDLEQLTSAAPSPVLASGYFAGADGDPGMMPATGCPQGQEWSEWYGKCIPHIPAPPPPPVSSVHASGEYVGDGTMPATGCPVGSYWSDYYGKCVANIPPPPPPLPDTFAEWKQQHQTSGEFAGYGWEYEMAGAPAPTDTTVQDQTPPPPPVVTHPTASSQQGHPVSTATSMGTAAAAASLTHPAIPLNAPPAAHAAANAADANAHAQVAQAVAAHPSAPGTGAEKHAAKAYEHASASTTHAHLANVQPEHAHEHAHRAAHHAHMARRHASHIRREGYNRRWHEDYEHHGLFGNFFGHRWHHHHGFSRHYHAFPEWHGWGHPAWRGGINPMWGGYRAECAGRSGPRGIFGFLFGWNRRYCAIERCYHPQGFIFYRVTPAGLQEGVLLEEEMVLANQQYEAAVGQAAPDADAGPLEGSDDKASGAIEPDHAGDDDTDGDEGDADDASDTATTGDFAGFDLFAHGGAETPRPGWGAPATPAADEAHPHHPQSRGRRDDRRERDRDRGRVDRRQGRDSGRGRRQHIDPWMGSDDMMFVVDPSMMGDGGIDGGDEWWHHRHHHDDFGGQMVMPMPMPHEHHDYVPMQPAPQPITYGVPSGGSGDFRGVNVYGGY